MEHPGAAAELRVSLATSSGLPPVVHWGLGGHPVIQLCRGDAPGLAPIQRVHQK